ncbi:MAG: Gfo/Idh/MocA family oxidoreductase [Clostridiales bacterium]|nr:Gfo/Idh/MocA family oxidoreductase [Clostridiales bacterium]
MLSYIIVGSGYRAEYFGRIAAAHPGLFRALFLCRSQEKAEKMTADTGIPATLSESECCCFRPDFAVIAVDRAHIFQVAEEWINKGFPVLAETPVGETPEQLLKLWELEKQGAKVVCSEQYHRQPVLMNALSAISEGLIGTPSSAYVSLAHEYHAASLIRKALLLPAGESFTIRAMTQKNSLVRTDSRETAYWDGKETEVSRDAALITFASGRFAVYDFCAAQYRSFIRSKHLTVRGSRGEVSDASLAFVNAAGAPEWRLLNADIPEKYRVLDTQALRDRRRVPLAGLTGDTAQDEFAIASLLLDMGGYINGGPSPYPLKEALEDAYFTVKLKEALSSPYVPVCSERMPWHG